ncbi:insulin receptor substrate 1 [Ostrinia nubilalis]|uniref:insulin receptor substrate 1 n=1 Tax=Ostrinia nubilalis TaxID=29057 RepID=UPI0030823B6D
MSAGAGGGAGAIVRQGHLRKLKTMKKKYFVLRAETAECSARLEYYESEKKFRAGASPRRVLPLKSCYNITRRLDLKQKHVVALFTREEQFCIVAENETDLHAWLTAILKQHRSDDASAELLHPIQHVWQVNVQKKGLGSSKNIQGLYNLCLTDKTLTLVKIKSHNNVISDLGIPERIEYTLKNIRRCGDSECFFYMEVGRQTATGAGELWMHSEDSNIAQSMHSTILLAMRNCAKESENERDHIILPVDAPALAPRSQSYSDTKHGRAGLSNAENQPPNNSLSSDSREKARGVKHHRTVSLPAGCPCAAPRVVHERTRSAPLAGEADREPKSWARRASTGARHAKLSPAHAKNAVRSRCDSMPSRVSVYEVVERPPPRLNDIDGVEASRDEPDAMAEWSRTPRIPEEPDCCDVSRDFVSSGGRVGGALPAGASVHHSRTSSFGAEDSVPDGYLPMAPGHEPLPALVSASSGSVCSGTPSTDPRFR